MVVLKIIPQNLYIQNIEGLDFKLTPVLELAETFDDPSEEFDEQEIKNSNPKLYFCMSLLKSRGLKFDLEFLNDNTEISK